MIKKSATYVNDRRFFWFIGVSIVGLILCEKLNLVSETLLSLLGIFVSGLFFLYITWRIYWSHPEQYGYGKVVSKRQNRGTSGGNRSKQFWITIQFESGEEIEFQVMRASRFKELNAGDQGTVTYRGTFLVRFE